MEKIDICFVCLSLKPGGGNRVVFELSERLEKQNYRCRFVFLTNKGNQDFSKLSFLKDDQLLSFFDLDSKIGIIPNLILTFFHLILNRRNYRLIIINNPLIAPMFGLLGFKNMYYYIQADDYRIFDDQFLIKNKFLLGIYKFFTKTITYNIYGNKYLFNSRFSFEKFSEISTQNIVNPYFILPAVDLSIFTTTSEKKDNLQKSSSKPIVISTIFRKHPWKGSQDFLKAVEIISEKGEVEQYKFVAITNEDISSFSISKEVEILRPKNDQELSLYLNQSDIFVATSWWEGFGLPALEAMACGCAVITSKNGGCNEYAVDKVNCLMYEPKDIEELTKLILELSHNEALRKEISQNAIQTSQKHSWDYSASCLVNLIKNPNYSP